MKQLRMPLLILLALVLAACSRPVPKYEHELLRTEPWSKEVVAEMSSVAVQDNGREKPLSVLAAIRLYKIHGRRDVKFALTDSNGEEKKIKLTPIEWLLDVWCYPEQAGHYPLFRIENSAVMDALGLANEGQKPDFVYISYEQVFAVATKLRDLASAYSAIDAADHSPVEAHIVGLWQQFNTYGRLHRQLEAFHHSRTVDGTLKELFGSDRVDLGLIATHADGFRAELAKLDSTLSNASESMLALTDFIGKVAGNDSRGVGLVGPGEGPGDEWVPIGAALERVIRGEKGPVVDMITSLQKACTAKSLPDCEAALLQYKAASIEAAGSQYNKEQIELETYYYDASWHYQSIHWFLFSFLLAAVTWLIPRNKLMWWASMVVSIAALGMLSYDLTLRCLITGHPPIKNLYDTFLFIGAISVLLLIATEFVVPRRMALAAAPFFGALLVMFARMYEVSNGADTMDKLQAVLDSNFWLATHVTTINIGYAAGLMAAALAYIWIFLRVFRISHPSAVPAKALIRMCYGVTCFGLLFSVVGTILGGVWANDSWGRFWGWDPKENGALMICLAQISLLHARLSGWVRDFGFVIWAGIIGIVVVFSWFHVNLLQVGLHAYGFSSELREAVWISYSAQGGILIAGAIDVLLRPSPARAPVKAGSAPPLPIA
ncbi:MAG: ABC-type transport system involved in cytochrome c biogenesis permease subunit [Planctomycetota bacterium]|jgi:ABC-type transport system involved in cytochrome c biogenesis permease subunit